MPRSRWQRKWLAQAVGCALSGWCLVGEMSFRFKIAALKVTLGSELAELMLVLEGLPSLRGWAIGVDAVEVDQCVTALSRGTDRASPTKWKVGKVRRGES